MIFIYWLLWVVYVYVFDINSAAPLIDMRIVATHSMHKGEPRLIAFKRNPGLAAICRGKEWSIMHGGVYLGSWATGDDDQKKTRLNNTPFFGMPSTTNVSESGGHENLTTKTTASGIAEVGRANAGGGMAVLQGGSGLVVPPTNNTASSSSRSSEAAAEGTLSPSPGNADDVLATMQSFAMVGGGAVGTVLSENIAEEDEEEEEENTREDEDQQD